MKWQHRPGIRAGRKGDISYIAEEFDELTDAHSQGPAIWAVIEASDVVAAVGKFTRRTYGVPLWLVILLAYVRLPYKFLRNRALDALGIRKGHA